MGLEGPTYEIDKQRRKSNEDYQLLKLEVEQNREWCKGHYLLKMKAPEIDNLQIKPGQFFHMICDNEQIDELPAPLTLRRPFSIHGTHYAGFKRRLLSKSHEIPIEIREIIDKKISSIDVLYKLVGNGTSALSKYTKPGDLVDAIGPCGNGFTVGKEECSIVVAGGIGIAPLVALAEELRFRGKNVFVYFGALNPELLNLALTRSDSVPDMGYTNGIGEFKDKIQADFKEIGVEEVKICTYERGEGETRLVTDLLEKDLNSDKYQNQKVQIYACGPRGMLKVISQMAKKYSIECYVLLEERMACGIGACYSCTCDTMSKNGEIIKKRVCIDGPVFNASDIVW
jgi:dihydroorotate dehydrogenase electron transfer subunit